MDLSETCRVYNCTYRQNNEPLISSKQSCRQPSRKQWLRQFLSWALGRLGRGTLALHGKGLAGICLHFVAITFSPTLFCQKCEHVGSSGKLAPIGFFHGQHCVLRVRHQKMLRIVFSSSYEPMESSLYRLVKNSPFMLEHKRYFEPVFCLICSLPLKSVQMQPPAQIQRATLIMIPFLKEILPSAEKCRCCHKWRRGMVGRGAWIMFLRPSPLKSVQSTSSPYTKGHISENYFYEISGRLSRPQGSIQ